MLTIQLRPAKSSDLDQLVYIEEECFITDQLSRQSFARFIESDSADLIVALKRDKIVGYFVLLYHQGTSLSRLYSMAVSVNHQKHGIGKALFHEAERISQLRKKYIIRLEVRPDNIAAIRLFEKQGYWRYSIKHAFYEDESDAFCFEKRALPEDLGYRFTIPYYAQNTDFTCGPASLIMAMMSHSKKIRASFELELDIWREATTIFMTSGHGGCGPRGLALAAHKRGFPSEVWLSKDTVLFEEGLRSKDKKYVLGIVHHQFVKSIRDANIPVHIEKLTIAKLEKAVKKNGIPLVLISSYKITKSKAPHWVVVAGHDKDHFYIHDPELDPQAHRFLPDVSYIPVPKIEFLRMAAYGASKTQAVVIIYPKSKTKKASKQKAKSKTKQKKKQAKKIPKQIKRLFRQQLRAKKSRKI